MQNYIQPGNTITLAAPHDVTSGGLARSAGMRKVRHPAPRAVRRPPGIRLRRHSRAHRGSGIPGGGGSTLYNVGDPGQAVFTVRTGVVKLVQYLPNGTYRIVRLLTQGRTARLEATVGEPYSHSAVAVRESLVCRIPSATVEQLRTKNPDLCKRLMGLLKKMT